MRPFIRTSLSISWLHANVTYDFSDDHEYEIWIREKHSNHLMQLRKCSGNYQDYICLQCGGEGCTYLDLKDYFRLTTGMCRILDEDEKELFMIMFDSIDEDDDVCYVRINDERNDKLIDGDYHIYINGPTPNIQKPKMTLQDDHTYVLLLTNKHPKLMTNLPFNFVQSNVKIDWSPNAYKKIKEWMDKGWLEEINF